MKILVHCANVLAQLLLLKQDAHSIQKFEHPGTRRELRKREVEPLKKSLKSLRARINKQLASWTRTQCVAKTDVGLLLFSCNELYYEQCFLVSLPGRP